MRIGEYRMRGGPLDGLLTTHESLERMRFRDGAYSWAPWLATFEWCESRTDGEVATGGDDADTAVVRDVRPVPPPPVAASDGLTRPLVASARGALLPDHWRYLDALLAKRAQWQARDIALALANSA